MQIDHKKYKLINYQEMVLTIYNYNAKHPYTYHEQTIYHRYFLP